MNVGLFSMALCLLALTACDASQANENPSLRKGAGDPRSTATDAVATNETSKFADATFVQSFMGNCVLSSLDIPRIEAAAATMRMKRITDPDMLRMLGPANGSSDWKGWAFKADGKRLMLAAGRNTDDDGRPVQFCVLISELADVQATKSRLVELLHAKREAASEEAGQRYEIYRFEHDDKPMHLNFIDGGPMGMKILNASTMVLPRG